MNPVLALIVGEIVSRSPALAIDIVQILSKPDATDADWAALRARWSKPWDQKLAEAEARAS